MKTSLSMGLAMALFISCFTSNAQNLIDMSDWVNGTTGSTANYSHRGAELNNSRVMVPGPYGDNVIAWKAVGDGESGFNGGLYHKGILVDNSKTYRVSFWIKSSGPNDCLNRVGFVALPPDSNVVIDNFTREINGNTWKYPYFSRVSQPNDKWYLVVGYIRPNGAIDIGDSGLYDSSQGTAPNLSSPAYPAEDLIFPSDIAQINLRIRSFLYNCASGEEMFIYDPRVEESTNMTPLSSLFYGANGANNSNGGNGSNSYAKRINCGSSTATANFNGQSFEPETSATGVTYNGELARHDMTYAGVSEPLRSFRYTQTSGMDYNFSVPNGTYRVKLHFVEPYHGPFPGTNGALRVFNVNIEGGQHVENDLNVWSAAGSTTGGVYTIDEQVNVTDGNVTIEFSKVTNDPIVNAIEIIQQGSSNNNVSVTSVSVASNLSLNIGEGGQLSASISPANATNKNVSWSSSNASVASVSGNGYVTANSEGTATITATTADGGFTDTATVTVSGSNGGGNTGGGSGDAVWTESGSNNNIYYTSGNVGISTTNIGGYELAVGGEIRAEEVRVDTGWADYVFSKGYDLPTLEEVQKHIQEKGHLPNIPSAKEVKTYGIELGEMNRLLLEKIEELTLYILQQERRILQLENQ